MTEPTRDPLRAWPIIDGPMQGQNWAYSADYFYAAEVVVPGMSQPSGEPAAQVSSGRTEYRLRDLSAGGYAWSCAPE